MPVLMHYRKPATSCSTDKDGTVHSVSQRPLCPQVNSAKNARKKKKEIIVESIRF